MADLVSPAQISPKSLNRATVLRSIQELGATSRAEIAARTGLSAATVSRVADELIQAKLLTVTGTTSTGGLGRRSELLRLNARGGRVLGVHLGGHSNDIGLADLAGNVYSEAHLPLVGHQRFEEVFEAVACAVEELVAEDRRSEPLLGIGVATGGVVDPRSGRLISHGRFPWSDVPLQQAFEARFERYIAVGNSFQGLAWYESLFSGLDRQASLLFVNCSTIIGAGFSTPNNLIGTTTLASGQLGHTQMGTSDALCTCGRRGCLQATASDPAICEEAERVFGQRAGGWDIFTLGALAATGNEDAVAIFKERSRSLAPAIAVLANTLAPSFLVLGHNRHDFAEAEHKMIVAILNEALFPPLRGRIEIRPVREPEQRRAVAAPVAIILRDVYSPSLSLVRAPRNRLIPELAVRAGTGTPWEDLTRA